MKYFIVRQTLTHVPTHLYMVIDSNNVCGLWDYSLLKALEIYKTSKIGNTYHWELYSTSISLKDILKNTAYNEFTLIAELDYLPSKKDIINQYPELFI